MKTGNKNNYVYYDWSENISRNYIKGYTVSSINHSTGEFETEIEMTKKEAKDSYELMMKNFNDYKSDDYDVRLEQDLYN